MSVTKQASQRVVSFFNHRDTLHLSPFCTSINSPSSDVWSDAPKFGVVLHNWVTLISDFNWVQRRMVNLTDPVLSSTLHASISQKSCSKPTMLILVLQVLAW